MPAPSTGQVVLNSIPLLVVPNTYARGTSALYGRPGRLGDPQSFGPLSTWKQATYIGGLGQEKWTDSEMYFSSTADTRFGYAQCRHRLERATSGTGGETTEKLMVVRPVDVGPAARYLYSAKVGETTLYKRSSLVGSNSNAGTLPAGITALGRSFHGGQFGLHVGCSNGALYTIASGADTSPSAESGWDTGFGQVNFIDSLGPKGDIAGASRSLYKHFQGKWSFVASTDMTVRDGEAWNQRMYVVASDNVDRSKLLVTDTITTQDIHEWPNGFVAKGITLHYGTLYITGYGFNEEHTRKIGQLWSYNGSSVRLVYSVPDEVWQQYAWNNWTFAKALSWDKWLLFSFPHRGLYTYDPEQDSLSPVCDLASVTDNEQNYVSALAVFGGRLVASNTNEAYAHWEDTDRQYVSSFLISSEYDAGLPIVSKQWLKARIRLAEPLPSGASVTLKIATTPIEYEDDPATNPDWQTVGTFSTAGDITKEFNISSVLGDFRSVVLRYSLTLTPTTWSAGTKNSTPKVSSVEVDFMPVEDMKYGWNFQAIGADDMRRPDGSVYTHTTAAAVESALATYFRNDGHKVVTFTDKDGTDYKVKLGSLTQYVRNLDADNPDGEHIVFDVNVNEV
jgi:hypothetical protein